MSQPGDKSGARQVPLLAHPPLLRYSPRVGHGRGPVPPAFWESCSACYSPTGRPPLTPSQGHLAARPRHTDTPVSPTPPDGVGSAGDSAGALLRCARWSPCQRLLTASWPLTVSVDTSPLPFSHAHIWPRRDSSKDRAPQLITSDLPHRTGTRQPAHERPQPLTCCQSVAVARASGRRHCHIDPPSPLFTRGGRGATPRKTALPWPPCSLSPGAAPAAKAHATPTRPCDPQRPLTSGQAGVWGTQVGWGQPGFDSVALSALLAWEPQGLWAQEAVGKRGDEPSARARPRGQIEGQREARRTDGSDCTCRAVSSPHTHTHTHMPPAGAGGTWEWGVSGPKLKVCLPTHWLYDLGMIKSLSLTSPPHKMGILVLLPGPGGDKQRRPRGLARSSTQPAPAWRQA